MNTILSQGIVFFQDSKKTVIFSTLVVFTLVLEEIFESVVFHCPCQNHLEYGLLFLLVPSVILFVAGILLNPDTWWICRIRRFKAQHKELKFDHGENQCCRAAIVVLEILSKALISPTMWLILSFLQKNFFVCAAFGPGIRRGNPKEDGVDDVIKPCENLKARSLRDETQLMAKSQTIGLVLSLTATVLVLLCGLIGKCCGYKTKVCLPDEKYYMRLEALEAAKEFNERAKMEAKKQGKIAVEQAFEKMTNNNQDNYLVRISNAAQELDKKYSSYYSSSLRLTEDNSGTSEDQGTCNTSNARVSHCRFEENVLGNSFIFVDGKENSAGRETERCCTISSEDKMAGRTHAQTGITRVTLRRAKSTR